MDIRHLRTFREIVEQSSFQKAADSLQYAQSTITLHIQQLETTLGITLFDRQSRKVRLTEAGQALLEEAELILGRLDALPQTMTELAHGEAGHVRIGASESVAHARLPDVIWTFSQARPHVRITLELGPTLASCQRVASGDLDFGLCTAPPAALGLPLRFEELFTESMVVLLPEGHPLAQRDALALPDVLPHQLLMTERTCGYREVVEAALRECNVVPTSTMELGSTEMVKRAVQRRMGLALVPHSAVSPPPDGTVVRPLSQPRLEPIIGIVQRISYGAPSQAVVAFLDELRGAAISWGGHPETGGIEPSIHPAEPQV
jgi:DNA-binding transcriptional LysR family regulator